MFLKFSVIMPIHNEEKLLHYSLPSVYRLNPDEVILLFDNCKDDSFNIASGIVKKYDKDHKKTRFVSDLGDSSEWRFRIAYVKRKGLELASFDTVLIADADTIIHEKVKSHLNMMKYYKHISFSRIDYPINWRSYIKRMIKFIYKKGKLGGLNAVSVSAYKECEDKEEVKKIITGEDALLRFSIQKKYPVFYVDSPNIHLRPKENYFYNYNKGVQFWQILKTSFLKVIFSGVVSGRFSLIKGYIHYRYGKKVESIET